MVTQTTEKPEAVLLRALWPQEGIAIMQRRRGTRVEKNLCSGPAKLCEAFAVDRAADGLSLLGPELWIEKKISFAKIEKHIKTSPRIGIDYAGKAKHWPLRFFIDPSIL